MINIGLCSLVNNLRMKVEIPKIVKRYLNILLFSLIKEQVNESKRLKKINQKEIKDSFIKINQNYSDSESEDDVVNPYNDDRESRENNFMIKINKKYLDLDLEEEIDIEKENEELIVILNKIF